MFSQLFDPEQVEKQVHDAFMTKESNVAALLNKERFVLEDLPALLSPAAEQFLDKMINISMGLPKF